MNKQEELKDVDEKLNYLLSQVREEQMRQQLADEGEIPIGKERNEGGIKQRNELITDEKLMELAKQPNTTVYQYVQDDDFVVLPMSVVRPLLILSRKEYLKMHKSHPEMSDDQIRLQISKEHPEIKTLFANHGKTFEHVTARTTDAEKMKITLYMIYVREQVEQGKISEAQGNEMVLQALKEDFEKRKASSSFK